MMGNADPEGLLEIAHSISRIYPDTATFLGDIAVWIHCRAQEIEHLAPALTDVSFALSAYDFGDLKDTEIIHRHNRLGKHAFIRNDLLIEVHAQYQTDLAVPVEEIISESKVVNGTRLADLGHLLKLKSVAATDRKNSAKGEKDQDDIIRILLCLHPQEIPDNVARLDEDDEKIINQAIKGEACVRLTHGNLHEAKLLRSTAREVMERISKNLETPGCEV